MNNIEKSIYGFIIGDACGVPFEFRERDTFKCDEMIECNCESFHHVPLGTWSDDTSLMLCTLNAFCASQNNIKEVYKQNCIDWLYEGKYTPDGIVFDIGNACRKMIAEYKTGVKNMDADKVTANGNGGLMKISPISFLGIEDDEEIVYYINLFNKESHNHYISNYGCLIYIKLLKDMLLGSNIKDAIQNLKIKNEFKTNEYKRIYDKSILDEKRYKIKSTGYVVHTLEAAIWCTATSASFEEAVFKAVNLGDDTDTVAAITGSFAGIQFGIPKHLLNNIRGLNIVLNEIKNFENAHLNENDNDIGER